MKKLGHRQQEMLDFLVDHPGRHSLFPDAGTVRIAKSLAKYHLINLTDCGMCTATGRTVYIIEAKPEMTIIPFLKKALDKCIDEPYFEGCLDYGLTSVENRHHGILFTPGYCRQIILSKRDPYNANASSVFTVIKPALSRITVTSVDSIFKRIRINYLLRHFVTNKFINEAGLLCDTDHGSEWKGYSVDLSLFN